MAVEWKCRCWTACFTADTEIDTPGGPIPIAKISAGQVVYCYDETTQAITLSHVVRQWRARRAAALVEVILDNGAKIRCTPDHLFMRRDGTYATANSLLPGDSLMPLHRKINHYARSIDKRINTTSKRGGWVTESRFIASWLLGRPLVAGEQVHHRDHNHLNDHPSNLQVMSCSEHMREHRRYSNPMNDLDVRARMAESRKGQRMGDSNPMRRPEVIANFMGDKNCQRRPEVAARM